MSHSLAIFWASSSLFFFSPLLTRQFSSRTTSPGLTSKPPSTQSVISRTGCLSSWPRRTATGIRLSSGVSSPSVGRPRWEVTITAAPFSRQYLIDGSEARMRVSSVMLPASSCGTLRSARMKTRLPATSRSVSLMTFMDGFSCALCWVGRPAARPVVRHFQHAVGKAPLVVEPDKEVDQMIACRAGLAAIDDGGMGVVIESDRGGGRLGIGHQALERAARGLLQEGIDAGHIDRVAGVQGQVDG